MINKEFEITIEAMIKDARVRNHEYLTVEHILYAVLHDEIGADIISACGGDVAALKSSLDNYFNESVPKSEDGQANYPQPTVGFQKVFQRALLHTESAAKEETDAGDILASLLLEEDSHAVYLLHSQGIKRIDVLNYISHGLESVSHENEDGLDETETA